MSQQHQEPQPSTQTDTISSVGARNFSVKKKCDDPLCKGLSKEDLRISWSLKLAGNEDMHISMSGTTDLGGFLSRGMLPYAVKGMEDVIVGTLFKPFFSKYSVVLSDFVRDHPEFREDIPRSLLEDTSDGVTNISIFGDKR